MCMKPVQWQWHILAASRISESCSTDTSCQTFFCFFLLDITMQLTFMVCNSRTVTRSNITINANKKTAYHESTDTINVILRSTEMPEIMKWYLLTSAIDSSTALWGLALVQSDQ